MHISEGLIWHQISTRTWYNRYLLEFLICKELMSPKTILSFGCSTGEECATLQTHFPEAEITGCDINPDVLKTAKERYPEFRFLHIDSKEIKKNSYDAVFAMNVFHRNTQNCEELPFYERGFFDTQIAQLQQIMTEKAHLILYASQYTHPLGFELVQNYGKLDIYVKSH